MTGPSRSPANRPRRSRVSTGMSTYLPNHQKKNRIFAKRERELRHAIKLELPLAKVHQLAEKVREAKIGVFKCRYAHSGSNQPHTFDPEQFAELDAEAYRWLTMTTEDVVEAYRKASQV
jgi:hypothetical protein